jgi:copper chaperone CopZ
MRCEYCAKHLENKLQALDGVNSVKVDVEAKRVQIDLANGQTLQEDQLTKTIKDAGFTLVKVVEPAT